MEAYKYIDSQFRGLWEKGSIRVNTMNALKTTFQESWISDTSEGIASNKIINYSYVPFKDPPSKWYDLKALGVVDIELPQRKVSMANVKLVANLPDAYIVCLAIDRDDKQWFEIIDPKEGGPYNCLIKIKNVETMADRITQALNAITPIKMTMACPCIYESNQIIYPMQQFKLPSYFRKPTKYSWQTEFRMVFLPFQAIDESPLNLKIQLDDLIEFL
jgi:hypothetical protein